MARLIEVRDSLIAEISVLKKPLIVLEGYSFASKGAYAHETGELGGVVKERFYALGWPWVHVPPTVRAKFAAGRGNASKGEVVSAVSARTGIVWTGSGATDECDAWVLQEMGFAHLGEPRYDWPAAQLAVLGSVDWSHWEKK
jgi:crossover junction endodeoxyribonuclease RuvC